MPADTLNSYNLPFLEAMYEQYVADPQSVDPRWRSVLEANAVVKNGHARPSAAIPADS